MACFLVPAAEAVVTTVAAKSAAHKLEAHTDGTAAPAKRSFVRKLKWLSNLLWGGAALLMFEHVWHGEVAPWFPFLTAAADVEERAQMLHEMSTVGVTMAVLITLVWVSMVLVSGAMERKAIAAHNTAE